MVVGSSVSEEGVSEEGLSPGASVNVGMTGVIGNGIVESELVVGGDVLLGVLLEDGLESEAVVVLAARLLEEEDCD